MRQNNLESFSIRSDFTYTFLFVIYYLLLLKKYNFEKLKIKVQVVWLQIILIHEPPDVGKLCYA